MPKITRLKTPSNSEPDWVSKTIGVPRTDPVYQNLVSRGMLLVPPTLNVELQPPAITADQNNYRPSGIETAGALHLNPTGAARTITGIEAGQLGLKGRMLVIHNISATLDLILANNVTSVPSNRFNLGANVTISPSKAALLHYDRIRQRWYMIGSPFTAAGGGGGYATIQDEGVAVVTQTAMDVKGLYASAQNDAAAAVTRIRAGYAETDAIVDSNQWESLVSDTADVVTGTTIQVTVPGNPGWVVNEWARCRVLISSVGGVLRAVKVINSNTSDTITWTGAVAGIVAGDTFIIQPSPPVYRRLWEAILGEHLSIKYRAAAAEGPITITATEAVNTIVGDDGADASILTTLSCSKAGVVFDTLNFQNVPLNLTGTGDTAVGCRFTGIGAQCVLSGTGAQAINCATTGGGGITPTLTLGAGQTQRANNSIRGLRAGASTEPGSAGTVMSWTLSAAQIWAQYGVAILPATATILPNFIAATSGTGWGPAFTLSHANAAGTNRMLLVGISYEARGGQAVTDITYGGNVLTKHGVTVTNGVLKVEVWRLLDAVFPSVGAQNLVVTLSEAADALSVKITEWTLVHQTTPLGVEVTATGNSTTPTLTVASGTDAMIHDAVATFSALAPFEIKGTGNRVTACLGQLLGSVNFIKVYTTAIRYLVVGNENIGNAETGYIIEQQEVSPDGIISANVLQVPSTGVGGIRANIRSNIAGNFVQFVSLSARIFYGINVNSRCVVAGNMVQATPGAAATTFAAIRVEGFPSAGAGNAIGNNLLALTGSPNNALAVYSVVSLSTTDSGSSLNNVTGNVGYALLGIAAGACYLVSGSTDFTAFGNIGIGIAPTAAPFPWRQFQSLGAASVAFANTDLPEPKVFRYDQTEDFGDNAIPADWVNIVAVPLGTIVYGAGTQPSGIVTITTAAALNDNLGLRYNQNEIGGSGKLPGFEARFDLGVVNNIEFRIGLAPSGEWVTAMARPTSGLWLELDTALDANFHLLMRSASGAPQDINLGVAAIGFHTIIAHCSRGNRISAWFDGTFVGTMVSTGIWAVGTLVCRGIYLETLNAFAKDVDVDLVRVKADR